LAKYTTQNSEIKLFLTSLHSTLYKYVILVWRDATMQETCVLHGLVHWLMARFRESHVPPCGQAISYEVIFLGNKT